MYTVLIADDNTLTLQALTDTVPWENWGFSLVGQAESGTEALKQIEQFSPDVAILDISMPGLSGLQVAEKFRNAGNLKTLIIFLTAYDEFSYAQTALKLGAFDYLLKPLDNEQLDKVLGRAKEKLDKESQSAAFQVQMEKEKENYLGRLLARGISGRETQELEALIHREWKAAGCALMLINTAKTLDAVHFDELSEQIKKRLAGLKTQYRVCFAQTAMKEGLFVLVGFRKVQMEREYDLTALRIATALAQTAREDEDRLFIGISRFAKNAPEILPKLCEEASFAVESRFFLENKTVIHYKSITSKSCQNEYLLSRKMQELLRTLNTAPEDFPQLLEEFIELLLQSDLYNVEYVKNIITQIAFTLSCSVQEKNGGDGSSAKSLETILSEVHRIAGMKEILAYIREYARQSISQLQSGSEPMSGLCRRILDYMNAHYMENLTLGDVAEEAGISESHLCRVLKKETGESFVNLLNKLRVQQAQKLLQRGELKVYEIAEAVGFSNYAYFYQVFKKLTGYSPRECH